MRRLALCCATLLLAACGDREQGASTPQRSAPPTTRAEPARANTTGASTTRPVARPDSTAVAVRVGGEEELDPCSLSAVRPQRSGSGGYVAVRSGPGSDYPAVDSLAAGAMVLLCDGSGDWSGVVFAEDPAGGRKEPPSDCGLSSPIARQRPYRGPCKAGWIPSDAQEVVAG